MEQEGSMTRSPGLSAVAKSDFMRNVDLVDWVRFGKS